MKPITRYIAINAVWIYGLFVFGQNTVTVDLDRAFPSYGSRAPIVFSEGGTMDVVFDTTDTGPPMRNSLGVSPGARRTPTATLTFTGMVQTPSIDGTFTYKPPLS